VAQTLDPENPDRGEKLAELYLVAGPDHADKAVAQHMRMLRAEPFKYDSYKALRSIYNDAHQYDKTWCLCNTLAFLKKADATELQFFEQYKPRGLVKAKNIISPDSWGKLVHPDENRYISAVFAAVWQGVAAMKAFPHKDAGVKRKDKRNLQTDQLMFSKLFYYVSQVLALPLPEVFLLEDGKQTDIQLANFVEKDQLIPSFVVRPNLLQGKNERETRSCRRAASPSCGRSTTSSCCCPRTPSSRWPSCRRSSWSARASRSRPMRPRWWRSTCRRCRSGSRPRSPSTWPWW
jgi:hypothetical protein